MSYNNIFIALCGQLCVVNFVTIMLQQIFMCLLCMLKGGKSLHLFEPETCRASGTCV